jgi:hypothetical protein
VDRDFAMAVLRLGRFTNILIGIGHVLSMLRMRELAYARALRSSRCVSA